MGCCMIMNMNGKMYIQVILNPEIPEEKELIDYRNKRYGHIGNKALVIELMKKDMESRGEKK